MTQETADNEASVGGDQRRLHVAHVTIEFDFAFVALPDDEEVASSLIEEAADDLSSLHDYATVTVSRAAPSYEMPMGWCEDDCVYGVRTASGFGMKWSDAVANDKRLRAPPPGHTDLMVTPESIELSGNPGELDTACTDRPHPLDGLTDARLRAMVRELRPDLPAEDVEHMGLGEMWIALGEATSPAPAVLRLDYTREPPRYMVGAAGDFQSEGYVWWTAGPPPNDRTGFRSPEDALTAAWEDYKERHDPPGMRVTHDHEYEESTHRWFAESEGIGASPMPDGAATEIEARAAAWAWHDRRLALANAVNRDAPYADMWPRSLTFSDENAAVVERWLVDSTAEMPEVLRAAPAVGPAKEPTPSPTLADALAILGDAVLGLVVFHRDREIQLSAPGFGGCNDISDHWTACIELEEYGACEPHFIYRTRPDTGDTRADIMAALDACAAAADAYEGEELGRLVPGDEVGPAPADVEYRDLARLFKRAYRAGVKAESLRRAVPRRTNG